MSGPKHLWAGDWEHESWSPHARALPRPEPERVVVEAVTRRAGEIALEDGSSAIRTRDLLEAVMQLYGAEFDRALSRHGVDRQQLRDRLGLS